MLSESISVYLYEPYYISILLLLLGIIYIGILIYSFSELTFTIIGYVLVGISLIAYLLVGLYMTGKEYYLDKHSQEILIFGSFGFLELSLLTYPYIFLTLAVVLGKKESK